MTIPIELAPRNKDGAMISLRGEMQLGVCEDICIPVTVQLKADLGNPGAPDETIRASLKKRPATAKESKVASVVCKVDPISDGLRLTTRIKMPRLGRDEVAVVELPDKSIWVAPSTIERSNGALILTTELVPANAAPFLLNRADVRITVLGGGRAVDIQGCTGS